MPPVLFAAFALTTLVPAASAASATLQDGAKVPRIGRRDLLSRAGGSLAAATASLAPAGGALAAPPSFVAFGDSYTAPFRNGVPSWAEQTRSSGAARQLANLALGGATAEGADAPGTFDGQVDAWIRSHKPRGVPDRTVVYFGYNDVRVTRPLAGAKDQYRRQVDRLIANGVTQGARRLVLCLLHDWSRNPATERDARARVVEWNDHVRGVAASRPNCVVVDLFARFEDVFRNPGRYGFANVTVASLALSATTHLYADDGHFGGKGQRIIADAVRPRLL